MGSKTLLLVAIAAAGALAWYLYTQQNPAATTVGSPTSNNAPGNTQGQTIQPIASNNVPSTVNLQSNPLGSMLEGAGDPSSAPSS